MNLGAFSLSLSVKDLTASRDFYAKLGFEPIAGNADENWQIQSELRDQGLSLEAEADESTQGPASCMVIDPDGNPILIDQHR